MKHDPKNCHDDDCKECHGAELHEQIMALARKKSPPTTSMKRQAVEIVLKGVKK